ncbi:MAG: cation-translocating P-type ATPase [Actinomycetia bacterium]|nr:cation-translocating P-type ATPase [Actinomycetes bacterium]
MATYGLNDAQVQESLARFGDNNLTEQKTNSFWKKLRSNFGDPMIKILCVALAINILFAILGEVHWYESLGIALAVALATLVSTFSEYRNENVFQHLQKEASRIFCKVYRNGGIEEIGLGDIVVGDAVLLQTGDVVPADGVLIDGSLAADQSALNGEAKEAKKSPVPLGTQAAGGEADPQGAEVVTTAATTDAAAVTAAVTATAAHEAAREPGTPDPAIDFLDPHRVFRGAVVVSGNAVMSVSTVGDASVYGQIAKELQEDTERDSPLKVKLKGLAKGISRFGYIGGVTIAVALLFQRIFIAHGFDAAAISAYFADWMQPLHDLIGAVMLAVVIIVMAVPEGLPLMIAIVSALNMGKMLKDHVLVRKVNGIETAGSLNLLFSDKTGTITRGQLETVLFADGEGQEYRNYSEVTGELARLLQLSVNHNTNVVVNRSGQALSFVGGNATERAIMQYVADAPDSDDVVQIDAIPFSSENKYSAAEVKGQYRLTLIKGAPERVLGMCQSYYIENGERREFSASLAAQLDAKVDALAARSIRVIALATSSGAIVDGQLPADSWTLVGIMGIRDEVRPESIDSIREVHGAGVQVVMITGDRRETAVAIGTDAGLLQSPDQLVLTSDEMAQMSDDELRDCLSELRIVARALPSDKSRLVRLAKEKNLVVGMTGDGVNDSPALKAADVGFAMGGGTEVAKEASDIVILNDNFSSIDKAILYGRTIFNSIRKFIVFQLTINVAAVMVSFVMPLLGERSPLTITQILWVNLVMDTLAALAFGGEPALRRFMAAAPKRRDEPIVSRPMWSQILTGSVWIFVLSLVFLLVPTITSLFRPDDAHIYLLTGYFALFVFTAVFNAFNARTERLNLFDNIGKNKGFIGMIAIIVAIQVLMLYIGGAIFDSYGLMPLELAVVIGLAVLIIPVDLCRKLILGKPRGKLGEER